jgi:hypothetical protein
MRREEGGGGQERELGVWFDSRSLRFDQLSSRFDQQSDSLCIRTLSTMAVFATIQAVR